MASEPRASSISRVSDQATLENAVIPSVQFGPVPPVPHCGYDEYPYDKYTTIRISVEHDSCWFLNSDGSVAYEVHKVTYRFTMFGMEMKLVIGALIDRGANACLTGADQRVFCTYNRRVNIEAERVASPAGL